MQTTRKRFSADLSVVDGERAVVAKISTAAVDRDKDVLLPSGARFDDFEKSPTVFYNHDYDRPIGKAVSLKRNANDIEAKTVFAVRPESHEGEWLPDTVFALMQQGVINGFSVGFGNAKYRPATDEDKKAYGNDVERVFTSWDMMEYSVAPLPANQEALASAVSKGIITQAEADMVQKAVDDKGRDERPPQTEGEETKDEPEHEREPVADESKESEADTVDLDPEELEAEMEQDVDVDDTPPSKRIAASHRLRRLRLESMN